MTREDDRELYKRAQQAWEVEDWPVAGELWERLARRYPDIPAAESWWYNAARSARGSGDPAFWNLGIAATIMEDWATARDAWWGYGLDVPDGEGEIEADFGTTPTRLSGGEVVWARRLCPTRARALNVPTPGSGRRFGEVVVHDGAPNGERTVDGRDPCTRTATTRSAAVSGCTSRRRWTASPGCWTPGARRRPAAELDRRDRGLRSPGPLDLSRRGGRPLPASRNGDHTASGSVLTYA